MSATDKLTGPVRVIGFTKSRSTHANIANHETFEDALETLPHYAAGYASQKGGIRDQFAGWDNLITDCADGTTWVLMIVKDVTR